MKSSTSPFRILLARAVAAGWLVLLLGTAGPSVRGEAMLELFQQTWNQVTARMPEIAEAGYDSLWLPNPAKGNSGAYSTGYDQFDPFDLGSTNQQGTIATAYGTESDLIRMVETAHRFGIRVYFDNVMNHRAATVPGYPGGAATNYYPGLVPQDFHLQTVTGGFNNWPAVGDPYWCTTSVVENQPLLGLCDLAQEPGTVNWNFGKSVGNTTNKPVFVRFPGRADLYMDTNGAVLGAGWGGTGWRPFDGHGQPVAEDVSTYLCRAIGWTLWKTKCDGFRFDAVKHVPVSFFGNETGRTDDPYFAGYTGMVQAMYDYVHGYGSNVTGNGYVETDGCRNSLFNPEAPRNDAMLFGEYESSALAAGADYYDYLNSGMRLINFPMFNEFNNIINNADNGPGLSGFDGRDYAPNTSEQGNCDGNGNFSLAQGCNMIQDQDGTAYGSTYYSMSLENAYFFLHEGLPMIYADGFNHNYGGGTPIYTTNAYLGEFGDNLYPEMMTLHNQLARGGTWSRWSDQHVVAFERYDYREGNASAPQTQDVVLFAMNDKTSYPGDITFDDGVSRTGDGYYGGISVSNTKSQGLAVGFAPGSVLVQMAGASPTGGRAYRKLLVHGATTSYATAQATANASDPTQRLIYVGGQTIPSGGGAIELNLPSGAWVEYAYQWPEPARANVYTNVITLRQNGQPAPHLVITRTDGPNGDPHYAPAFPFNNRGGVDAYGNVIMGANVSNLTYAIDIPIVTNAPLDILVRCDASASNALVKLDGGLDLNSQMGLGTTGKLAGIAPTNFIDLRDNPPGYASDVFLGYEQTGFQFRNGPEKFAARNILSNNIVSLGAEIYSYTVGGTSNGVAGNGYGQSITNQTANWVWHDPTNAVTSLSTNPPTQRSPISPAAGQSADIWVKVGYQFQINTCYLYYTTDGSTPEGAFGQGKGTTQVVLGNWVNHDSVQNNIDWWKVTLPGQPNGTQVRYKVALFNGGSYGFSIADTNHSWPNINPISDAETSGAKYYGLTQFGITNFNPGAAVVWPHNDLNVSSVQTGLTTGFHILRARTFLPRTGQSSVYGTYSQTFYYDGALPGGAIPYPANSSTIGTSSYTVVVRADPNVTSVQFNIQDSNANNDDLVTHQANGNGNDTNGNPIFVAASAVSPNASIGLSYPNYPQEFRFNYTNVPGSGTATISVRLLEYGTSVYPSHYTALTATVNTLAPQATVELTSPATNGTVLNYSTNMTYLVAGCYSSSLGAAATNFNLFINGNLVPSSSYIIRPNGVCAGMAAFYYNWNNPPAGTNQIILSYTNSPVPITDSRIVVVTPPIRLANLTGTNNQLVMWNSIPGVNYAVLATTNLTQPFQSISGPLPSQGNSMSYYDSTSAPQKFYEVELLPFTGN